MNCILSFLEDKRAKLRKFLIIVDPVICNYEHTLLSNKECVLISQVKLQANSKSGGRHIHQLRKKLRFSIQRTERFLRPSLTDSALRDERFSDSPCCFSAL